MKIKDHKAIAEHIGSWLKEKLTVRDTLRTAVLGLSGGIDSGLVALLCVYNNIPIITVNMPCHSSKWAFERSQNLAKEFGFKLIEVKLDISADNIQSQVDSLLGEGMRNDIAGLYSCIRTPTLDYVSKRVSGVIVGTGNRDEDGLVRYYSKRGDGCVDISPIADLHKSEVRQMFEWLAIQIGDGEVDNLPLSAKAILEARPSADLWGGQEQYDDEELGLSYGEVEWADIFFNTNYPGFFELPNKNIRDEKN